MNNPDSVSVEELIEGCMEREGVKFHPTTLRAMLPLLTASEPDAWIELGGIGCPVCNAVKVKEQAAEIETLTTKNATLTKTLNEVESWLQDAKDRDTDWDYQDSCHEALTILNKAKKSKNYKIG
jgi:hypothetical protein